MTLPLALMPIPRTRWFDANGAPLSDGYLQFFVTGTSTPKAVYADPGPSPVSLGVEVDLDAEGYAPAIFLASDGGYRVSLFDENDVEQWTEDGVESVAEVFIQELGSYQAEGRTITSSGDTVLATDQYLLMNVSSGPNPAVLNLQPVAERTFPLVIKNIGARPVALTPQSTELIEYTTASITLDAGTYPNWPTVTLIVDQSNGSYVVQSGNDYLS